MNNKLTDKYLNTYLIILIPLLLFGVYKNGIKLSYKENLSILEILRPIILILMSTSASSLGALIKYKLHKSKNSIITLLKKSILEGFIISSILPINTSPIIAFLIILIFNLFKTRLIFNKVAFIYLIIITINSILGINEFKNVYELNNILNLNGLDLFIGKGIGGICSTNIFLILIGLVILTFNPLYKKNIVYSSLISYSILTSMTRIILNDYESIIPLLFNGSVLFSFVFIASDLKSSCYTKCGQIKSGLIIGILTVILINFFPFSGACISILLISILKRLLDKDITNPKII